MLFRTSGAVLAITITLHASAAQAQVEASTQTVFADATGAMWGLATFETTLIAMSVMIAGADLCDDDSLCGILAITTGVLALGGAVTVGFITDSEETPPDAPFVWHSALTSASVMFLLGGASYELAEGGRDDGSIQLAGTLGFGTFLGFGGYTYQRRGTLLRDPGATVGTHIMTWGPTGAMAIAGIIAAATEAEDEVAPMVIGLSGFVMYVAGVTVAELNSEGLVAPAAMPLFGVSGGF